jgi:hypothetical protein
MVPLVVFWLLYVIDEFNAAFMNFEPFGEGLGNLGRVGALAEEVVFFSATAYVILVAASMMAVAFSRERDEDEYVASVRMRSLVAAFWADFVILTIATLTVNDFDYLNVMVSQMFLILLLHIVIFNVSMAVIRRRREHEE